MRASVVLVGCLVACQPTADPPQLRSVAPVFTRPATAMQIVATEPGTADLAPASPYTLTATDGHGLVLARLDARAVVEGPLAFTELHLYFDNVEHRVREGTFAITLPPGAAVSRFAKQHDGQWQEAEVVERTVARRAYDDFLHRRQDPALLEKGATNQFSAKVFPIAARSTTHLVIAYSQELPGRAYTLPLRGLPKLARVDVQLAARGLDGAKVVQALAETELLPAQDFSATVPATAAAVTAGEFVVGSFAVPAASARDAPTELTLLVDTSASRGLDFAGYVRSIRTLVTTLRAQYGDELRLQVIAFDQEIQSMFAGTVAEFDDPEEAALIARGAAGASDLGGALAKLGTPSKRLVIVTDGVMTAGAEQPAIIAALEKLPLERVDVVLVGGIRDEALATALVRTRLPRVGGVFDLERGISTVATGLGQAVLVDLQVSVTGAAWVYPRTISTARPGSVQVVYVKMANRTFGQRVTVMIGGRTHEIALASGTPALVERAVAGAEIAELEAQLATTAPESAKLVRSSIVAKSVAARVVSSQTSMLVLESEDAYARYGIERTALADILEVSGGEVVQRQRTQLAVVPMPPPRDAGVISTREQGGFAGLTATGDLGAAFDDAPAYQDPWSLRSASETQGAFGDGGFIGTGIGGGRGGRHGRAAAVPSLRMAMPTVEGSLDRAFVRRYLTGNIQKLVYCYEKQLLVSAALRGSVALAYTIQPDGTVRDVTATGFDRTVDGCIAGYVKEIEYPRSSGDVVRVRVDLSFAPDGGGDEPVTEPAKRAPLIGKLAEVMAHLGAKRVSEARTLARAWLAETPGDVLAVIANGEVAEAERSFAAAARFYGSIIDLYPNRADLRRFAGERLERLGATGNGLAIDTYRRAVADRPDHATGHRLLAYALLRGARHREALTAILTGVDATFPPGRFAGAERVLAEDAAMIAAVAIANGVPRPDVERELAERELVVATEPSTRFIMYWETDANDVDFHIRDARGGHAWYNAMTLPSGGELYADITTGYGPECFAIAGPPKAAPYRLSINYFSQGPMGYGMGLLQIMTFDGTSLRFSDRPYVIMQNQAFVDLGTWRP